MQTMEFSYLWHPPPICFMQFGICLPLEDLSITVSFQALGVWKKHLQTCIILSLHPPPPPPKPYALCTIL